ncbi:glycosyltransferase family 2 protein [Novosphingopyxis sp.]|uniref:glycosyltransferase family 2 protein n=1 Tax=Novosphingopyxis sp. TaxID=2709690 RepID=UPI003B5BD73F
MTGTGRLTICTIVRGRERHLRQMMLGVRAQRQPADRLVIAYMQDEMPTGLPDMPCELVAIHVKGEAMPLAAARNRAAELADADHLLFLDVDCIPDPELVRRVAQELPRANSQVLLPEVRYLSGERRDWTEAGSDVLDYDAMVRNGVRHPAKPLLDGVSVRREPDHGELWGLAFALHAADWQKAGGMDEDYRGYGAEETDFAYRLQSAGIDLAWLGRTKVYHQHHAVHVPPLHHFEAIIRNARLFHTRWGRWCMDYWLGQFADIGLVHWEQNGLEILRQPTQAELAASLQPDSVRFS